MKIRSLAAAALLAVSILGIGCDHLRSKDASAEEHNTKTTASAPQSVMPSSDRYGGGNAGQPQ